MHIHFWNKYYFLIFLICQCCIHNFFGICSISLIFHHGWCEVKIFQKFAFLDYGLARMVLRQVFCVHFLHVISNIFFVIKLFVFVPAYIMFNIALVLNGHKILIRNLLAKLGEDFSQFCMLLVGLFFLDKKVKQVKFR